MTVTLSKEQGECEEIVLWNFRVFFFFHYETVVQMLTTKGREVSDFGQILMQFFILK